MSNATVPRPFKTLFLIPTLKAGGAERVTITLLRHLDRTRIEPLLGVVDLRESVFRGQVPEDVPVFDLQSKRLRYAVPSIVQLIRRVRPDVVFSTLEYLNLALALSRNLLPGETRLVARQTTLISIQLASHRQRRLWDFAYRKFYRRLDHVICQSRAMRDDLVSHSGISVQKTSVIYNPVDVENIRRMSQENIPIPLSKPDANIRIVAAGRLSPEKGLDLLLHAVAECSELPLHLDILGDGPAKSQLQGLTASLGITDRVTFVGFQSNPYAWFAGADALVLTSRYEGLPNVALEALACRTPVIWTPAPGGTPEILGGVPECEAAEGISATAIAAAIRRWVIRRPGRVSEAAVLPYSASVIAKQYENVIRGND